ncbi:ABC transporter substrate-binding protein [Thalassospira profundimaris]|uniref:ABC transporter substrate-binding protein n=1 Tax=Thalassospira profundimaris TaxID=502049 RepID=UPI000DED6509|nr:ABC transporter substrate-binding protein [Thalassospira profundimaris]
MHVIWSLAIGALLSFGALPARADAHRLPRVAFINPGYGDRGFWKDVSDTMHVAAKQFGMEIVEFDSDRQWPLMAENASRVFAMDPPPDYIVASNEHQQGGRIILEANARKIPIFMILNDLTDAQKRRLGRPGTNFPYWIATLTPDNRKAGYEIARSLVMADEKRHPGAVKRDICLLSLAGDRNTPASLARLDGLDMALAEFPQLVEKRRLYANWSYEEGYNRTAAWLPEGCLDAIWAANDDIARGAISAIREAGRIPGKDVMVGGLNWSAQGLKLVKAGEMTMTHGGHFLAGAWIMVMVNDYRHGIDLQKMGPDFSFPMQAITRENIDLFEKKLGDRNWAHIDFSAFSLSGKNSENTSYHFDLAHLLGAIKNDQIE